MRQRVKVVVTAVVIVTATVVTTGPTRAATHETGAGFQSMVNAAVADLQAYWAKEFPQVYGGAYKPVAQIIAAGPTTKLPDCQGHAISYQKVKGNAFYCFQSNFLAYDN